MTMKGENPMLVLLVTSLLAVHCQGLVLSSAPSSRLLQKMEESTRHLQELTRSMAELDTELGQAVLTSDVKEGMVKRRRSGSGFRPDLCRFQLHEGNCQAQEILQDQASGYLQSLVSPGKRSGDGPAPSHHKLSAEKCRHHLKEEMCQALEAIHRQKDNSGLLQSLGFPGKRSGDGPAPDYRKLAADLIKKKETLHSLRNVFDNAAFILEREKKWMTCNLNMGFTCQTEEYSNIADYYDFLNSADSPGKKRSAPQQSPEKSS
ncbi:uncharacterized protein LOC143286617 [Babylonia areolata]|uniref:uncharacterized protein LOC143286617 n=1 Tax=Babylonia areolata TaxID=304850 RepID=UPI003FD0C635